MNEQQEKSIKSWMKFLNPEILKSNLIGAAIYIVAFETLKQTVLDKPESFFLIGFDEDGFTYDKGFEEVLSRDSSPFRASMMFLQEMEVVDQNDLELADRIREHRNQLAHNLPRYIADMDAEMDLQLFRSILDLVTKIDRWWIENIEIPINSDFDNKHICTEGIQSGNMLFLSLLISISTGDELEAAEVYQEFIIASEQLSPRAEK